MTRIERDGIEIVVIRRGARLFAYQNSCPHAFWPLSEGALSEGLLECPGHGWQFDVETGACVTAPAYCLAPVPVRILGDATQA